MNFAVSVSSLRASQFAINTASQNIANANTAGYHRQRVTMVARPSQWIENQHLGSGVDIDRVDRVRNQVLEGFYTQSLSELSGLQEGLALFRQIESEFLVGDGSVHQAVSGFFSELTRLSANPSERVARDAVIYEATQIARQANGMYSRLHDMKTRVESQLTFEVNTLNEELAELVRIQNQIEINRVRGSIPNDLMDARDALVNRIAEKIDVDRNEQAQGGLGISIANSAFSIGKIPPRFEVAKDELGQLSVVIEGSDRKIDFRTGSILALQEIHNDKISHYMSKLNEFAQTLIREVDQVHAKGVGVDGPFELLRSARMAVPTNVPLADSNLDFAISTGQLTISITDPQGEKRTASISIDPSIDSLEDIATKLDNIDNLNAVVDPLSGQLSIFARPGYKFDFTGNQETIPELTNFSGTSIPNISGQYVGDRNRNIVVTIIGSGTIGSTPGLIARVTDLQSGATIIDLPIGADYEAGTSLDLKDGLQLSFEAGTVVDGDSFSTPLISESDSSGILSALGLNNFFSGTDASDMQVSSRILDDPSQLATSRSGDWADTSNLLGLIELRNKSVVGELNMTFQDYLADTSAEIGFEVKLQQRLEINIRTLNEQYDAEINAISGVDLNEELLNINQFQKQYDAAVQVIRTMDDMMSELMNIIR